MDDDNIKRVLKKLEGYIIMCGIRGGAIEFIKSGEYSKLEDEDGLTHKITIHKDIRREP